MKHWRFPQPPGKGSKTVVRFESLKDKDYSDEFRKKLRGKESARKQSE